MALMLAQGVVVCASLTSPHSRWRSTLLVGIRHGRSLDYRLLLSPALRAIPIANLTAIPSLTVVLMADDGRAVSIPIFPVLLQADFVGTTG